MVNKDIERELRGFYSNSFFHIYMDGNFNPNMNQMTIKDCGTFIHEYVHYLQNIGTLWGLGRTILSYNQMRYIIKELDKKSEIVLPLETKYSSKIESEILRYKVGEGSNDDNKYRGLIVDRNSKIKIIYQRNGNIATSKDRILLKVTFEDVGVKDIYLGAHIIKESMAVMYQSFFDSNAIHDDMPYNIVRLICKDNFSKYYDDTQFLICTCFAALFSMNPGKTLIDLLTYASQNNITDGRNIIDIHLNNAKVLTSKHKNFISIRECYDEMINVFLENLNSNLMTKLDYTQEVLNRVRISANYLPLITVLFEPIDKLRDNFNSIVAYYGLPYIHTPNGIHYPRTTFKPISKQTEDDASADILELNALEAVFYYLTGRRKCCPLYYMCSGSKYEKPECFSIPWAGNACSFTIVSDSFLKGKRISFRKSQNNN